MLDEGKIKLTKDLKPVRTRRIKPVYNASKYKLKLRSNWFQKYLVLIILAALLILCLGFLKSDLYQVLKIGLGLRNKNILVGFQNSAELRPTGGFWGSFGIWKISNNPLSSELLFETNPYKNDNKLLLTNTEPLPEPMRLVFGQKPQSFVNANWATDFPTAAKDIEWYLSQGWGQKVDGTIAVSSLAMIDMLNLTGPLELSDHTLVNSENFTQVMSEKIDTEYWQDPSNLIINEPKTILKELSPELIKHAKSLGYLKLYKFLLQEMHRGRILAYFSQDSLEKASEKLNISAEAKPYNIDYLSVNNSNIGGDKSSLNVNQSMKYSVDTSRAKSEGRLSITRQMNENWPHKTNKNYMRIIAPLGSSLIWATIDSEPAEVEATQENSRTCFGFWFSLDPGQTKTLDMKYSLPFENIALRDYNLVYQKQPGTLPEYLEVKLNKKTIFNQSLDESDKKIRM